MQILAQQRTRALEFGIYRDGDNNLDTSQEQVVDQARGISRANGAIEFTIEDTKHNGNDIVTRDFTIDGARDGRAHISPGEDMSDPDTLATFVAKTLDNAEQSGAKQTWIDLVDHGAGDGGGLEADTFGGVMPMQRIADAIERGVQMHAQAHPEDAGRTVDGVVANQCLMSTLGFADALSKAGVAYLAASPETMLSPGVPTSVAKAIADNLGSAKAMATAVVDDVMNTQYAVPGLGTFAPAAAFDVLDLTPKKIAAMETAVKRFNDDASDAALANAATRAALRDDIGAIDGMVRFPEATPDMPWHADRPAMAVYDAIAGDSRLSDAIRADARNASLAVRNLVLAHEESRGFEPFGGSSYRDAAGPTVHDPISAKQVDPWAPNVSETRNAFYTASDQGKLVRAIA